MSSSSTLISPARPCAPRPLAFVPACAACTRGALRAALNFRCWHHCCARGARTPLDGMAARSRLGGGATYDVNTGARIAPRADDAPRLEVWDCEERGGFVWLFFGTPTTPRAARPPIPWVPELSLPGARRDDCLWSAVTQRRPAGRSARALPPSCERHKSWPPRLCVPRMRARRRWRGLRFDVGSPPTLTSSMPGLARSQAGGACTARLKYPPATGWSRRM